MERRVAWSVALVAALTMTVSYVDRQTLANLAPTITKALDISDTAYGWLTSAFSLAYLVAVPLSGWWIDRQGARRGLMVSVLVWSVIAGLHAVVPGFAVLFALRIALGVAEAPSFPGTAQTMYRVLPAAERPRGYSLLFTGSSIGSMIAPPLASLLFGLGGWRIACLGTAIVGLAWLPAWIAVTQQPAAKAALDAKVEVAEPRLPFATVLGDRLMWRGLIGVLAAAPVVGFGMSWASKYLTKDFGIAQETVGYYLWLPPLGLDVGAIGFGYLASKGRSMRSLFAVAAMLASTLALLPATGTPELATVVFALSLAGGGGLYTLITADLLARTPAGSVSLTGGILTGAQSVALIIAGPLIGDSFDATGSYAIAAIACGAWVIPGSLVWWLWRVGDRKIGARSASS